MSQFAQVRLATEDDDLYSGFNDANPLESQEVLNDPAIQQAVARTSHGRRPGTGKVASAPHGGQRMGSALGVPRGRTGVVSAAGRRMASAQQPLPTAGARPLTAVRGVGYSSQGGAGSPAGSVIAEPAKPEENTEEKCKTLEKKVVALLEESAFAYDKGDYKTALEKAKEAGKKERSVAKLREQTGTLEQINVDLTFTVLFNLAHQYSASGLHNDALNTYQVIVKNKPFANSGRMKINVGNIQFKKKDYGKAIKYYRMALDQVPNVQKLARIKILNNIGVSFVRLGKYDEAVATFEHCMQEKATYRTGLNLILCAYTLEERERMREAFVQLLEIPPDIDDDDKYTAHSDDPHENIVLEAIKNDSLRQWERRRKQEAERTILTAARLISPAIASSYSEGYAWCVEQIKQSAYADLASDLEINKAVQFLKQRELDQATEVLKSFEKKDSKVASAAANNLSFVYFLQHNYDLAIQYAEQAINADRYNPSALVNRGNVSYARKEFEQARDFYKEALSNEASCVEALYNLGLASKEMGRLEEALDCFGKLHAILRNNVQVMYQIGNIYESLEDTSAALEWYQMAQNLAPTDPGIFAKLGQLYDKEGDKSQAFTCYYDSYKYFPSNIRVIEWLGAYYIDAQFTDKAVNYFEKAALIQPNEVKWQLMAATCHRREANYLKALEIYRNINKKFPENIECLKNLVRISKDLKLPEADEYASKLKKAEKVGELRAQRRLSGGSATLRSAGGNRLSGGSSGSAGRSGSSRGSLRTSSGRKMNLDTIDPNEPYDFGKKKPVDASYESIDHSVAADRPRTSAQRRVDHDNFDDEVIGDDLLPE